MLAILLVLALIAVPALGQQRARAYDALLVANMATWGQSVNEAINGTDTKRVQQVQVGRSSTMGVIARVYKTEVGSTVVTVQNIPLKASSFTKTKLVNPRTGTELTGVLTLTPEESQNLTLITFDQRAHKHNTLEHAVRWDMAGGGVQVS